MDRAEKIGLGAAGAGHIILLLALSFGLLSAGKQLNHPKPIEVTLVGEIAPVSTAPDATQEEPAPATAAMMTQDIPTEPPPAPEAVTKPIEKPVMQPVTKTIAAPPIKTIPKPIVSATAKIPVKTVKPTAPAPAKSAAPAPTRAAQPKTTAPSQTNGKAGGFSHSFETAMAGYGKTTGAAKSTGTGKATATPATKTAAEVKRAVTISLRNEILPYFKKCAPRGVDVNLIVTTLTLNIAQNGALSSVNFGGQRGVNDSNRPQSSLHKDCAINAVRAAAPYANLPAENYSDWQRWPMEFSTR